MVRRRTGPGTIAVLLGLACAARVAGARPASAPAGQGPGQGPGARALPVGSLRGSEFAFALAVFHLPAPSQDPRQVVSRLARAAKELKLLAAPPRQPPRAPVFWLHTPPIAEYQPPDADSLTYFGRGLTDKHKRDVAASRAVSVLMFWGPGARAMASYREALTLVEALARACGGLLWDEESRLLYGPAAWTERGPNWSADGLPDVRDHISIHAYRDGELIRMITLGMRKFALPDVVVNQVASGQDAMNTVISLLCQRLIEGGTLDGAGAFRLAIDDIRHAAVRASVESKPDAPGRATLRLGIGKPDTGDPDNRLVEITFPGPTARLQERHVALLDELLGSNEEPVVNASHDRALMAASRRAKKAVLKHKSRYTRAAPFGEQLMVKAPFTTSEGGREWMWVEIVRWEGSRIFGVLQNVPQDVPGLKQGARVEVEESSIFDYLLQRQDGSQEGNETGVLLKQRR